MVVNVTWTREGIDQAWRAGDITADEALYLVGIMDPEGLAARINAVFRGPFREEPEPAPEPMEFEVWRATVLEACHLNVKLAKAVEDVAEMEFRELEPPSFSTAMAGISRALTYGDARNRDLVEARLKRDAIAAALRELTDRLGSTELNIQ